jgi:hypothetical protein
MLRGRNLWLCFGRTNPNGHYGDGGIGGCSDGKANIPGPSTRSRRLTAANELAIRRALEAAGVEFIDENGGGPSVRLGKRPQKKR